MYFFYDFTNFLIPRQTLLQKIRSTYDKILSQSETQLTQTLLYDSQNYQAYHYFNHRILNIDWKIQMLAF